MTTMTLSDAARSQDFLITRFFGKLSGMMIEETSSHFVELPHSLPITADQPTTLDYEMAALETAVAADDLPAFLQTYENINWNHRPAQNFAKAIRLALQIGAPLTARKLAVVGLRLHPDQRELQKAALVLAPPQTTIVALDTQISPSANREWLNQNREQYKGQWVALRNGSLLASALTREEVRKQIGDLKNSGALMTKVY